MYRVATPADSEDVRRTWRRNMFDSFECDYSCDNPHGYRLSVGYDCVKGIPPTP